MPYSAEMVSMHEDQLAGEQPGRTYILLDQRDVRYFVPGNHMDESCDRGFPARTPQTNIERYSSALAAESFRLAVSSASGLFYEVVDGL